jgi:hypothetical protein
MPPLVWRVPVYAASWIVPARTRHQWRRQWAANLSNGRILMDRGELPESYGIELVRRAIADASRERFGPLRLYRFLRGPIFLTSLCLLALLLIAILSSGFTVTRALVDLARDVRLHPDPGVRYDIRADRLFEYLAPIVIAASVGLSLLFLRRRALHSLGWRSWMLLSFKMITMHLTASLLWIEGGHAIRAEMAREGFHFGIAGLGLAIVFVLGFGFATLWNIADQRRRCPVCQHRLVMPVALGSWASVFNPAVTELVCEEGHGSLSLMEAEAEPAALDRWTELGPSWRYLFQPKSGKSL